MHERMRSCLKLDPLLALILSRGGVRRGQIDLDRAAARGAEDRRRFDVLLEPHEHLLNRSQCGTARDHRFGCDIDRCAVLATVDSGGELIEAGVNASVVVDQRDGCDDATRFRTSENTPFVEDARFIKADIDDVGADVHLDVILERVAAEQLILRRP